MFYKKAMSIDQYTDKEIARAILNRDTSIKSSYIRSVIRCLRLYMINIIQTATIVSNSQTLHNDAEKG